MCENILLKISNLGGSRGNFSFNKSDGDLNRFYFIFSISVVYWADGFLRDEEGGKERLALKVEGVCLSVLGGGLLLLLLVVTELELLAPWL